MIASVRYLLLLNEILLNKDYDFKIVNTMCSRLTILKFILSRTSVSRDQKGLTCWAVYLKLFRYSRIRCGSKNVADL